MYTLMISPLSSHLSHPGSTRRSILIVEDNIQLATCLEMLMEAHGFEVCRTSDVPGALEYVKLQDFEVILCDLVMPGLTGDRFYSEVSAVKPHLRDRFVFMSGHSDEAKWVEFADATQRPVFWKPFAVGDLLKTVELVAESNRQAARSARTTAALTLGTSWN